MNKNIYSFHLYNCKYISKKYSKLDVSPQYQENSLEINKYPMWKVILIGNQDYNKQDTLKKMQEIFPFITYVKCVEYFAELKKKGEIHLLNTHKEESEFYVFKLMYGDNKIYSRCEPLI